MFQLGDNQLTGSIPPEICRYKNLESFYIGSNNLTGNLPEEFVNIMYANPGVWNNCLSGEVPIAITEHPNWSSRAPFISPKKKVMVLHLRLMHLQITVKMEKL